jgi:hypothetical protein
MKIQKLKQKDLKKKKELHSKCRKLGITFEPPLDNETEQLEKDAGEIVIILEGK